MSSSDLKSLRDSVSEWSSSKDNFDFGAAGSSKSDDPRSSIGPLPAPKERARVIGASRGPSRDAASEAFEREERRERDRTHHKRERKEFRKQQELVREHVAIISTTGYMFILSGVG